jgi:hypothetical protein
MVGKGVRSLFRENDGAEVMHRTINWKPKPMSPYFSVGSGYSFANPISGPVDELFIYDEKMTTAQKRAFLCPQNAERELYDMFRLESLFLWARAARAGRIRRRRATCTTALHGR